MSGSLTRNIRYVTDVRSHLLLECGSWYCSHPNGTRVGANVRDVPMIGRAAELGAMTELLEVTAQGPLRTVLVDGEAGIGKTWLVAAVLDQARARGFQVFSA